jgi:hypothetical protein
LAYEVINEFLHPFFVAVIARLIMPVLEVQGSARLAGMKKVLWAYFPEKFFHLCAERFGMVGYY